jgi:predicted nucleotide-binding protein
MSSAKTAPNVTGQRPLRPRVFIGSSVEGLEVAHAVQAALYYDAEPVIWSQGVFGLSTGTLETLVAEANEYDFAVFILTADDLVDKRGQRGNAPRDNVLFELGLFMGKLGRDRTFFIYCRSDELLLPTDLAGVTAASYLPPSEPKYLYAALSSATTPILTTVRRLGPRSGGPFKKATVTSEIDALRTQVAEMRLALSSFAAYAQALKPDSTETPVVVPIQAKAALGNPLSFLQGTWKAEPSRSTAWCTLVQGIPKFLYCYGGSGEPTGEFHEWRRIGNTLRGRFRWFQEEVIRGWSWFEIVGERTLIGGWWMESDVPKHLVDKLPHVPNMIPMSWNKQGERLPLRIRPYFGTKD